MIYRVTSGKNTLKPVCLHGIKFAKFSGERNMSSTLWPAEHGSDVFAGLNMWLSTTDK